MTHEEILTQLGDIYFNLETYREERLSAIEIWQYHERKLLGGELITVADGDLLVGYVEFHVEAGCCFIENLFVREGYRRGKASWLMKRRLFEVCKGAKVFLGDRQRRDRLEAQLRRG
jgi:hypothetical protein